MSARAKRWRTRKLSSAQALSDRLLDAMAAKAGVPEQRKLVELWRNWALVMGPEIAGLGAPVGHSGRRLDVASDEGAALQELRYLRDEILERANAFMEEPFFEDVRFTLILDAKALDGADEGGPARRLPPSLPKIATGKWLSAMDPDSPLARCYRAFCIDPERPE